MGIEYRIGCSGYYYRAWQGVWYPRDIKTHRWFQYYAECFDTVEINASFYRFPTASSVRRWYRQAPAGFVYSVKAPRLITHLKRFNETESLVKDLYGVLSDELSDKLGCVLFQMPPSFHYDTSRLAGVLDQLDCRFVNVLEFRHQSWWCEEVYKELKKARVTFCTISAPKLPDELISTTKTLYIRLHGIPWYKHEYSPSELEDWAERIRSTHPTKAFIYFNNDFHAHAPNNAIILRGLLSKRE